MIAELDDIIEKLIRLKWRMMEPAAEPSTLAQDDLTVNDKDSGTKPLSVDAGRTTGQI